MKKFLFCIIIFFIVAGSVFSQLNDGNWRGLLRTRLAVPLISLIQGGFGLEATWVPYIMTNIGIPINVEYVSLSSMGATFSGFGLMTGFETVIGGNEKNGLFLTALLGPAFFNVELPQWVMWNNHVGPANIREVMLIGRTNVGYQIVTDGGFVFTPALGFKFSGMTGTALDLMLDIGFAYRNKRSSIRTAEASTTISTSTPTQAQNQPTVIIDTVGFLVVVDGISTGPYTISEIRELVIKGEVTRDTLVWRTGMQQWTPAGTVNELSVIWASIPPLLPPR